MTAVNKTFKVAAQFSVHASQAAHQGAMTALTNANTTIIRGAIYQAIMAANVSATVKGAVALLNVVDSVSVELIVAPPTTTTTTTTTTTVRVGPIAEITMKVPYVIQSIPNIADDATAMIGLVRGQPDLLNALIQGVKDTITTLPADAIIEVQDIVPVGRGIFLRIGDRY